MPETLPLAEERLSDRLADQYWNDCFLFPIQVMPAEELGRISACHSP